jgi:hypothetical protein
LERAAWRLDDCGVWRSFFFFWEKEVPVETKNSEGVGEDSEERKLEKTVKRNCEGVFCELSVVFGSKKKRIRHSEEDEEDSRCRKCRRRDCEKVESEDEDEEELIHRRVRQWRTLAMLHKICTSL